MDRIGIRELRQHASQWVSRVRSGESIEVTDRGELVALLVPAQRQQVARDRLLADGVLTPATNPGGMGRLPEPRPKPSHSPNTQEILDDLRADRG